MSTTEPVWHDCTTGPCPAAEGVHTVTVAEMERHDAFTELGVLATFLRAACRGDSLPLTSCLDALAAFPGVTVDSEHGGLYSVAHAPTGGFLTASYHGERWAVGWGGIFWASYVEWWQLRGEAIDFERDGCPLPGETPGMKQGSSAPPPPSRAAPVPGSPQGKEI